MNERETTAVPAPGAETPATPAGGKNSRPKGCAVGHCKNCKRNMVRILLEMGMCHSCIKHARGTKGEDRVRALAEAAAIYGKLKPGERAPAAARAASRKTAPPAGRPPVEGTPAREATGGAIAPANAGDGVREVEENVNRVRIATAGSDGDTAPEAAPRTTAEYLADLGAAYDRVLDAAANLVSPSIVTVAAPAPSLTIAFNGEGDRALYERLCAEARRERRTPDQEALALLDDALGILDAYRAWKEGRS